MVVARVTLALVVVQSVAVPTGSVLISHLQSRTPEAGAGLPKPEESHLGAF